MGYGLKWRRWIQCCVEHVRFPVLINGSYEEYLKCKKGIRQGDPLSPFLFLIVVEALTAMMKKAHEDGFINGFKVSNTGTKVSHLQFVDDISIFLDASVDQVQFLRILLLCFEFLTGLRINFSKSHLFVVGYNGDMNEFTSLLGCYNSVLPTIYLGLPLGDKYKGIHKWDRIIDRLNAKLAGWKRPYLTRAGKIALINSVM
ncbi:uncharacterized protein LOC113350714 [Papaver somniferum]|uniref:uncharacterized protein LOC113350714 n=1 Tax=Papaver somniferum TaxID=3469 RepID=UPI000E702F9D|nr:uncharacterized protein LOC113350714 [Papaver somniferum]